MTKAKRLLEKLNSLYEKDILVKAPKLSKEILNNPHPKLEGSSYQASGVPIKEWDIDMFTDYVKNFTGFSDGKIDKNDKLLMSIFPTGFVPDFSKGSGLNNDEFFKKYNSFAGVMYDIWTEIQKVNKL